MSYDINNPADLQALNTEVYTDPIGMGYAAAPIEKTKELLKLLNQASNNVGGETSGPIFTREILMEVWEPKGTLNEGMQWIEALAAGATIGTPAEDEAKFRTFASPASLTKLDAIIYALSRAEVLFGKGTVLSENDWFAARDYV